MVNVSKQITAQEKNYIAKCEEWYHGSSPFGSQIWWQIKVLCKYVVFMSLFIFIKAVAIEDAKTL